MTLPNTLASALKSLLGRTVTQSHKVLGGDINDAWKLTLKGGERVFVKRQIAAPADFFTAEARGLAWLAEAGCIRVPQVAGHARTEDKQAFLVLEWIEQTASTTRSDERLGEQLAALHAYGAPCFGFESDNYIGRLPQINASKPSWPDFYRDCRLLPQIERAQGQDLLSSSLRRSLDQVIDRLADYIGSDEAPARLHGDLWSGNYLIDTTGAPCLIDPAVYGGHREIDLAMMRLFGGFGPLVWEAYDATYPLSAGWEARLALYQLYPLLVHVNLFGGAYVSQLQSVLRSLC